MKADVDSPGVNFRLAARFGAFELDCEAALPAHGLTAIVGPSGSGKTTLLRCVAGLARAEGHVRIQGAVWQDGRRFVPTHRRGVGYVFQEPSLLANLSVRENLRYAERRAAKWPGSSFEEVVEILGVGELLSRAPDRLSGGERQRVAIARALLARPQLLLMDEPLSSLDTQSKAEILPYLERLPAALRLPILYVSHHAQEVARLAERVLTMRAGRLTGPVEAAPRNHEQRLAGLSEAQTRSLALAALAAGLEPPSDLDD